MTEAAKEAHMIPKCNWCILNDLRDRFGVERVSMEARHTDHNRITWTNIMVDGHVVTVVAQLSEECICNAKGIYN
jgi:hypothetical protein